MYQCTEMHDTTDVNTTILCQSDFLCCWVADAGLSAEFEALRYLSCLCTAPLLLH